MSKCNRSVPFRTKAVECEDSLNWYHKDCGGILDEDYKGISEKVWFCKLCNEKRDCELMTIGVKLFLLYLDDIVRVLKGNSSVILRAANNLHPNLQITLETPNK